MRFGINKYPGAAVIAGAIGGLVGAWVKLGWEVAWPPRAPDRIPEPMVLVSMFTHVPTPVWQSYVIHFTFSILSGTAYGALVEFFPIVAIGTGVVFGLVIWIGAHEIVMPLLHLTPTPLQLPPNEQASELFGHALWGWVIGVFYAYYRPKFTASDSGYGISPADPVRLPVPESVAVFKTFPKNVSHNSARHTA